MWYDLLLRGGTSTRSCSATRRDGAQVCSSHFYSSGAHLLLRGGREFLQYRTQMLGAVHSGMCNRYTSFSSVARSGGHFLGHRGNRTCAKGPNFGCAWPSTHVHPPVGGQVPSAPVPSPGLSSGLTPTAQIRCQFRARGEGEGEMPWSERQAQQGDRL